MQPSCFPRLYVTWHFTAAFRDCSKILENPNLNLSVNLLMVGKINLSQHLFLCPSFLQLSSIRGNDVQVNGCVFLDLSQACFDLNKNKWCFGLFWQFVGQNTGSFTVSCPKLAKTSDPLFSIVCCSTKATYSYFIYPNRISLPTSNHWPDWESQCWFY